MFSLLYDLVNYLFEYISGDSHTDKTGYDIDELENFLECELFDLEAKNIQRNEYKQNDDNVYTYSEKSCVERTGKITFVGDNYALVDGNLYLELDHATPQVKVSDTICYLCYRNSDGFIKVIRCIQNLGNVWDEPDALEKGFDVTNHTLVAQVDLRKERFVYIKDSDVKFSLDDVDATFVPIKGDWLDLLCQVQFNEQTPSSISLQQIVKVVAIRPVRKKIVCATITEWDSECGVCNKQIYFNRQCVPMGFEPCVGSKVVVEAIESDQGPCIWRALKLESDDSKVSVPINTASQVSDHTFEVEELNRLEISHPLIFNDVNYHSKSSLELEIVNNSEQTHYLHRWKVLSKKQDSQIIVEPFLNKIVKIYPKEKFTLNIVCKPKFLGKTKETLILLFSGFQVKRSIDINVTLNNEIEMMNSKNEQKDTERKKGQIESMINIRKNAVKNIIPGVQPKKAPAFISQRLGVFPIPDKIWAAVLGDGDQVIYADDYSDVLSRIETLLPCLSSGLNINNYNNKWHTLLYMEEIQQNISMRSYDLSKVFLDRCQEYLSIEIPGLLERRPSLIQGDKVIVKDIWNPDAPQYQGFIHCIRGNRVLMKFNPSFHEVYSGYDVAVEFHFGRTVYRRCHQAVNLAITNLGPDILFPSRIKTSKCQIEITNYNKLTWYNSNLNNGQKAAILNILEGVCRPLPYCIYGPPGTGKTVTVIETILQILHLIPESRILVATPSNSASNLVTERLIKYRDLFTGSISRLIARHLLDSDTLPDSIKPFCCTLDIALENTRRGEEGILNGINVNCQRSSIGRHRVIIGTCVNLGLLTHMGLPKGHFTHVIVDEAGQATEPEIMVPLTFIDKDNGQIILAGDPMQLGPVVLSKYCQEFGLNDSYLQRLLDRFPYQKDYDAFKDQCFDQRLITRLTENYRSLEELLYLPSSLFYDGQLVSSFNRKEIWVNDLINIISDYFSHSFKHGGIFVYGIQGQNTRAEDSPSWYNPQEAAMVLLFTCKLYKKNVTPEQIGIITPYIAQIKYLRQIFLATGCDLPKIGTVEEFQGQERPIILLSTVKSAEPLNHKDMRQYLGFINNPKRVNVALTRAQVAAIVFCNPHVLCTDSLWKKVLLHAIKNDNYTGCDLPSSLQA